MTWRTLCRAVCCGLALLANLAAAQTLTVSAAASLGQAMREMARLFEAAHSGASLRLNFAASGVLTQQMAQGAPVDVLLSADEESLRRGLELKLLDPASQRYFATNQMVLVVPQVVTAGASAQVKQLADLAQPAVRRIALGKPATVPAGRHAQQALQDAGLWLSLQPRLVLADNVRLVLDYVARGEVDAGFVYRTDAALMPDAVRVIQVISGPVRYPAAAATDSRQPALARTFIAFLLSPEAQAVLQGHGFGAP